MGTTMSIRLISSATLSRKTTPKTFTMTQFTSKTTTKMLAQSTTSQIHTTCQRMTMQFWRALNSQYHHAGLSHMVAESAKLLAPAKMAKRRVDFFATQSADLATKGLVQSAGSVAQAISVMMELSALNQRLTDVELALSRRSQVMRDGSSSSTQSAGLTTTTLAAAFAHPTAQVE